LYIKGQASLFEWFNPVMKKMSLLVSQVIALQTIVSYVSLSVSTNLPKAAIIECD